MGLFDKTRELLCGHHGVDGVVDGAQAVLQRPEFSAAKGAVTALHPRQHVERLYVLGLGERAKFSPQWCLARSGPSW